VKKIRTGIASYGMSGLVFHAPLLHVHRGFDMAVILERTTSRSSERFPYVRIVRSYDEMVGDPELDLIVVNTPDHLHYEMCRKALEAGKHVVVEKPFTQESRQADDLIRTAQKKGLLLSVFQNRRWDSDFLTIRKIIDERLLGRLVEYEAHFDRFRNYIQQHTWKELAESGTGILHNLGPHLIDQALVLFGMPASVTADIRRQRTGSQVDDAFTLWLYYHEVKVTLKAGYLVRLPGPRYLLHGTEGSFLKWGTDPQEEQLKAGILPGGPDWGRESEEHWGVLDTTVKGLDYREKMESLPGNYLAYYDTIYRALTSGQPPGVTATEGRDVIRIIEAALKSDQERKAILL
jgi:scyllo-inositol 2-dehydrogenase (NADP+)